MQHPLRLMAVFAHPDDESLAMGATLAKYASAGVETYLVTATRGEQGWFGDPDEYPGPEALGRLRDAELRAAAAVLGLREVNFLDYHDGELDRADPAEVVDHIVEHLRRVRPQVVVTFDPQGVYGHPDHIAICQATTAAVMAAASPTHTADGAPHQVDKLYYVATPTTVITHYEQIFGDLVMHIDGEERRASGWEPWAVTTRVHTEDFWQQTRQAVDCHRSQFPAYQTLQELPDERLRDLWSHQSFYRVFSLVNGGRQIEHDLFVGVDG